MTLENEMLHQVLGDVQTEIVGLKEEKSNVDSILQRTLKELEATREQKNDLSQLLDEALEDLERTKKLVTEKASLVNKFFPEAKPQPSPPIPCEECPKLQKQIIELQQKAQMQTSLVETLTSTIGQMQIQHEDYKKEHDENIAVCIANCAKNCTLRKKLHRQRGFIRFLPCSAYYTNV